MSKCMTIVALVNGMVGGIVLVLPIMALKTGSFLIGPVSLIICFFSYYSSILCLRHLQHYKDLDESIFHHFNSIRLKNLYDIIIAISMITLLILYFDLLCEQWAGIFHKSDFIPIANAFVLFPLVYIMKKYQLGAALLGYGILSIIGYCIFIFWMVATTTENDNKHMIQYDWHFVQLAAALTQGYSIQNFFIPVLRKSNDHLTYRTNTLMTYFIGFLVYTFIGYGGAYSILNRTSRQPQPSTIEDYFSSKQWQVIVIQILYLIHLYSAFPEFLLISKKRLFGALKWKDSRTVSSSQIMYVLIILILCYVVKISELRMDVIIQLNGSIVGFCFIYLFPIALHIKCLYFKSNNQKFLHPVKQIVELPKIPQMQIKQQNNQRNKDLIKEKMKNQHQQIKQQSSPELSPQAQTQNIAICCDTTFRFKYQEKGEIILIIIMLMWGLTVIVYTLTNIIRGQN